MHTVNSQYFVEHAITPLTQTVLPGGGTQQTPQLSIHLDSCRVHFVKVTEGFSTGDQPLHVPHSPYSLDLALWDVWLFGPIKLGLAGYSFAAPEPLLQGFEDFWREFLSMN
jgi:hypothetical protein